MENMENIENIEKLEENGKNCLGQGKVKEIHVQPICGA